MKEIKLPKSSMAADDEATKKRREELRKRQLICDPIPLPKGKLAGKATSDEDALDVAIRELRHAPILLSKYKWFFQDYNEVKIILGEETVGLTEFGERFIRNPEESIVIGDVSVDFISCLRKIEDFISTIIGDPVVDYSDRRIHVVSYETKYRRILDAILEGDCFYEEVKLRIAEEEIALMQIKRKPLDRPIEINGETYQFIRVLHSIQSCLLDYDNAFKELYKDYGDEKLRRKREELKRKLMSGEEVTICEKNEDSELPFQIVDGVIVRKEAEKLESDDGEATIGILHSTHG